MSWGRRLRHQVAGALVVALVVSSSAAGAQQDDEAPSPTPRATTPVLSIRRAPDVLSQQAADQALLTELDAIAAEAPPSSCLVVTDDGRRIADHNPTEPLVPASNQKLLTSLAAVDVLGPDATLRTELRATDDPSDGTIDGDLHLVGGGDPLLATDGYVVTFDEHEDRLVSDFSDLVDDLAAAGVTEVTGDVVGDDDRYDDERWVSSWPDRYRRQDTVGPLSALSVNDGNTGYSRSPQEPTGTRVAGDPPSLAAETLLTLLEDAGIEVGGTARAGDAPADAEVVAVHESPPLRDLLSEIVGWSDNYAAELLLKELGVRAGDGGTTREGLEVVHRSLQAHGLPLDGLAMTDGSGLDLGNRLTCDLLADLLDQLPADHPIVGALSVAGETGTLYERLEDSPARARVRAKTGTLNSVLALSGFAQGADGRDLTFAFVVNIPPEGHAGATTALQDRLVEALVAYPQAPPADELAPLPPAQP